MKKAICTVAISVFLALFTAPVAKAQSCQSICNALLDLCDSAAFTEYTVCLALGGDPGVCYDALLAALAVCQNGDNRCLSQCPPAPIVHPNAVFYVDVNQHVDLLFFDGTTWNFADLTQTSGAGNVATSNSALTSWFNSSGSGAFATYYQGTNQHVYELYLDNNANTLTNGDVTAGAGGVLSGNGSGLSSFGPVGGPGHATYYIGANQHVYELYWNGSAWTNGDVTAATGNTPAASNSPTTTWITSNGAAHATYYIGANQHVYELYWNGSAWTNGDVTAATGGPLADNNSGITSFGPSGGPGHATYYVGTNRHVYELYWTGSTWTNGDVTAATGGALAIAGSGLTSFNTSGLGHAVYYISSDQHVHELYWTGSAWTNGDVTAATGGTLAGGSALTSFTTDPLGPGHAVYYFDTNHHVNELYWTGSTWTNGDVTAASGGTAAANQSGLTSFWHQ